MLPARNTEFLEGTFLSYKGISSQVFPHQGKAGRIYWILLSPAAHCISLSIQHVLVVTISKTNRKTGPWTLLPSHTFFSGTHLSQSSKAPDKCLPPQIRTPPSPVCTTPTEVFPFFRLQPLEGKASCPRWTWWRKLVAQMDSPGWPTYSLCKGFFAKNLFNLTYFYTHTGTQHIHQTWPCLRHPTYISHTPLGSSSIKKEQFLEESSKKAWEWKIFLSKYLERT